MYHKEGYVRSNINNGIAHIEFYHPSSNSLPAAILKDLSKTINDMGIDDRVHVIILSSGGERTFCAGASVDELVTISNAQEGKDFFIGFAHVINAMRKCHKLIIGRVQGRAVGGGVGLVAACDYAIALDTAEVRLSELSIGIGPFVVGPAVERKIGTSSFSQLAIDASQWRSAEWAKKRGLYAEIHSNIEAVDYAVNSLAEHLSHSSPEAMWEMKKIFWAGTEHWDALLLERAGISGRLILSEHSRKAIETFKSKLAPRVRS